MAKHRAGRSRRHGARVAIATQRGPRPIGITDARTHIEHLVTDESVAAHRHLGHYLAVCGAQMFAASLTAPEYGYCRAGATGSAR